MKIDQHARARLAWKHLVKIARNKETSSICYSDLAKLMKLHHRATRWFLGVIQEQCALQGLPPLQALVVNKITGLPGTGFTGSPRDRKSYEKAVKQVREFHWPPKAPF